MLSTRNKENRSGECCSSPLRATPQTQPPSPQPGSPAAGYTAETNRIKVLSQGPRLQALWCQKAHCRQHICTNVSFLLHTICFRLNKLFRDRSVSPITFLCYDLKNTIYDGRRSRDLAHQTRWWMIRISPEVLQEGRRKSLFPPSQIQL